MVLSLHRDPVICLYFLAFGLAWHSSSRRLLASSWSLPALISLNESPSPPFLRLSSHPVNYCDGVSLGRRVTIRKQHLPAEGVGTPRYSAAVVACIVDTPCVVAARASSRRTRRCHCRAPCWARLAVAVGAARLRANCPRRPRHRFGSRLAAPGRSGIAKTRMSRWVNGGGGVGKHCQKLTWIRFLPSGFVTSGCSLGVVNVYTRPVSETTSSNTWVPVSTDSS